MGGKIGEMACDDHQQRPWLRAPDPGSAVSSSVFVPSSFPEVPLRPRSCAAGLLLLILLAAGGCDRAGEIVVVPEFEFSESFEAGLGAWVGVGVDVANPTVPWSAEAVTTPVSDGARAARLAVDNRNGAAKVFLEREFEVAPLQAYDIEIRFDLGTSDFGQVDPWRVIAGAQGEPARNAALLSFQDQTGNGSSADVGVRWVEKSYTVRATADEDGALWVSLGVWATGQAARTYYLDDVRLVLMRASA